MSLQFLQRSLRRTTGSIIATPIILNRSKATYGVTHEADSCGIPVQPTWSVNQLLSSYPSPKLSSGTINRLYELSALVQPKEGTPQYEAVTKDLEQMVRLVEAVRLVDTSGISLQSHGEKEDADRQASNIPDSEGGPALLRHAARTMNGVYVVDSERRR